MIVKNEAHCIRKCLESVRPFIDYWVICDTGSSDDTENIVKEVLEDIPGEFHSHEWQDFSTNRNLALGLSKSKADHILIIDADDHLVTSTTDPFDGLDKNKAYKIEILHDGITYHRIQLLSRFIPAKYVGVLHEYLEIPSHIVPIALNTCQIVFGSKGSRSKNPNKYLDDAQVFEEALQEDPHNSRYVFYAAQSYRDANQLDKAIDLYSKRDDMGGWIEERYVSLLEIAKMQEKIQPNNILLIESLYLKAYNRYPHRLESLCHLASYCRRNKLFDKAFFYSKIGSQIPKPIEGLFIESSCYDWKILDELAISAYYVGDIALCGSINNALLSSGNLPDEQVRRITENIKICEGLKV
jgi:glycosyltransferase involved in cell wall biosynthesis